MILLLCIEYWLSLYLSIQNFCCCSLVSYPPLHLDLTLGPRREFTKNSCISLMCKDTFLRKRRYISFSAPENVALFWKLIFRKSLLRAMPLFYTSAYLMS